MLLQTYTGLLVLGACLSNALPHLTILEAETGTHIEADLTKRAR